jgi:hypothetical protein
LEAWPSSALLAGLEEQYLAGTLLSDLTMKDSKTFRKELEKILKEVFGC